MRSEPESLGLRGLGLCGHLEFYTREFYPVIPSDVMVFPSCPPVTSAGTGTVGGSGLAVPPVFSLARAHPTAQQCGSEAGNLREKDTIQLGPWFDAPLGPISGLVRARGAVLD